MEHQDHVRLIKDGVAPDGAPKVAGAVWADFGSGTGAFTLALADLLGRQGQALIISIDRDRSALRAQEQAMRARFPESGVEYRAADFSQRLELPPLDGIVMANALHFIPDRRKPGVLDQLHSYLKPGGRLVMVEYNADQGNPWVPHPFSFSTWEKLAGQAGFIDTRLLATVPSRFLREIYSSVSKK